MDGGDFPLEVDPGIDQITKKGKKPILIVFFEGYHINWRTVFSSKRSMLLHIGGTTCQCKGCSAHDALGKLVAYKEHGEVVICK